MKRNFLIGMAGISLALGMMVIGCDTGGGGGNSANSKTFTDGNYTLVIEKKSQQSQNALELPADTGGAEYSISSPASGDEFDYTLSNSGGIISRGTVKVTSTSTWSFTSSSGYTFTATFDGGSLKSFSGQVASGISGGQIGTLSPPATSKPGNSTSLAGTTWEAIDGGYTIRLTFAATTVTSVRIDPNGNSSTQAVTYTLSGNTVTLSDQGQLITGTVNGGTMAFSNGQGGTLTFTKVTSSTEDKTGEDTWSQITSVSHVVGTWKGSFTDTSMDFGDYFASGITAKAVMDLTYTIASTGSYTGSYGQTITFSGANIDQVWSSIKAQLAASGYSTNDSNHSASYTQSMPSGTMDVSEMSGTLINQSGTKIKQPAGMMGDSSPEFIMYKQ